MVAPEERGPGRELITARFDALRVGLSIGIGGGGVFALYLAWRRQRSTEIGLQQKDRDQADVARAYALQERVAAETREHQERVLAETRTHQERVAEATEKDAAARRITELYTKAAEQIGSDKAPVRLAGLYALERLAQDNESQRQTIVNVLCAYLRMPYTLPGDRPADDADQALIQLHRERTQEREVRLTAQRILQEHLRPGRDLRSPLVTFWNDIDLDFTGAVLINFDMTDSRPRTGVFNSATFIGTTEFIGAAFTGDAWFAHATFTGLVRFIEATFAGRADFTRTTLTGHADFSRATVTGPARFYGTAFASTAWFDKAAFIGAVLFEKTVFTGDISFNEADFRSDTAFGGATLPSTRYVDHTTLAPWTDFTGARFELGVPKEVERFVSPPPIEVESPAGG